MIYIIICREYSVAPIYWKNTSSNQEGAELEEMKRITSLKVRQTESMHNELNSTLIILKLAIYSNESRSSAESLHVLAGL